MKEYVFPTLPFDPSKYDPQVITQLREFIHADTEYDDKDLLNDYLADWMGQTEANMEMDWDVQEWRNTIWDISIPFYKAIQMAEEFVSQVYSANYLTIRVLSNTLIIVAWGAFDIISFDSIGAFHQWRKRVYLRDKHFANPSCISDWD